MRGCQTYSDDKIDRVVRVTKIWENVGHFRTRGEFLQLKKFSVSFLYCKRRLSTHVDDVVPAYRHPLWMAIWTRSYYTFIWERVCQDTRSLIYVFPYDLILRSKQSAQILHPPFVIVSQVLCFSKVRCSTDYAGLMHSMNSMWNR